MRSASIQAQGFPMHPAVQPSTPYLGIQMTPFYQDAQAFETFYDARSQPTGVRIAQGLNAPVS
jgi:hypothetical protein